MVCHATGSLSGLVGIVEQNALGRAVEILVLTAAQRPQETAQPETAEEQRHRDQEGEVGHAAATRRGATNLTASGSRDRLNRGLPSRRMALPITIRDDIDMAAAAISGVTQPAIAIGTASAL